MTDKERAADYLRRSHDARREARCVMDPVVRAGFHRVGDEFERMSAAVLRGVAQRDIALTAEERV